MKQTSLTDLRNEMIEVARGEREPPLAPASVLLAALSPEALALLQTILQERPETIARLAELTKRAQPNVSRSLQQLASLGLVRLERHGREVKPIVIARALTLDLSTGACHASDAA